MLRRLAAEGAARVALAVSGGSDSTALLALSAEARDRLAAEGTALELHVLTVDHALRPESAAEALNVRDLARRFGAAHDILRWEGEKPAGAVQAAAREARYELMAAWRRESGVGPLLLGHTRDDVAETLLLRLARGSGVDGLARMRADAAEEPEALARLEARPRLRRVRPLLGASRSALRAICREAGADWVDDPSNCDPAHDRVKARAAIDALGLDADRLVKTAISMARARSALERACARLADEIAVSEPTLGWTALAREGLRAAPDEIALRLVSAALRWTSGAAYPPRLEGVEALLGQARAPDGSAFRRTLHGVIVSAQGGEVFFVREPAAAEGSVELAPGAAVLWDRRFCVMARESGLRVAPLGAAGRRGLAAAERSGGSNGAIDAQAAETAPGVWRGEELVFSALAGSADAEIAPRAPLSAAFRCGAGS